MLPFVDRVKLIIYNKVMTIELEQRQRAWARLQRVLKFHAPENVRRILEKRLEGTRDIEDYEGMVEDYLDLGKLFTNSISSPKHNTPQNSSRKRYQRPFQKRLHLVYFIIGQQISSKKQRKKIRKRINWETTCKAWNEAHPNDPMTPKVLKATYYRAVGEEDLQQEFKMETGIWVDEALWAGWLSQVIEGEDLIEKWASLFMVREMVYSVTGKPLDDKQHELELEAVSNPNSVQERLDETIKKGIASVHNLDFNELKDLSDAEIQEIVESRLKEAENEG